MAQSYRSLALCGWLLGCGLTHGSALEDSEGPIGESEPRAAGSAARPADERIAGSGAEVAGPEASHAQDEGEDSGDVSVTAGSFAHGIDGEPESDLPSDVTPNGPEQESEAMAPDPVEAGPCPAPPAELFHVEGAGSGAISGCAQRTCAGFDIASYEASMPLSPYVSDVSAFAGCTEIDGDLVISNEPASDLHDLSCLERVSGSVVIWNNQILRTLDGLQALSEVGGAFELGQHASLSSENDALESFDALTNLQAIGGRLSITGDQALVRFGELPALRVVGGEVFIEFFRNARELAGMNALQYVGGAFSLWRPEGLERVSGLQALESIGGMLVLWGATDLVELDGFPRLACIGKGVDIGGDASWENNPVLRAVHAFPSLRTINGDLRLEWNLELEQFELMKHVTRIDGKIIVSRNPLLRDLPLDALETALRFEVQDNASLPECALNDVLAHVLTNGDLSSQIVSPNLPCP